MRRDTLRIVRWNGLPRSGRVKAPRDGLITRRGLRPELLQLEARRLLATFTVSNINASGTGSLAAAIASADSNNQANTIVFKPSTFSTPQTITLGGSPLELSDTGGTQSISGPTAGVTISGGSTSRVFEVGSGVTATLSGLTITGGNVSATASGGGLISGLTSQLMLTDCTFFGNSAGYGAGAAIGGTATLTGCTISDNSAQHGGGLVGGGSSQLTLTDCTVIGNSAEYGGGVGINGTAAITGCTISGNSADRGGGLNTIASAQLTVTDCTLSGNSAEYGGGLTMRGNASLTDCTISGNTSSDLGGGVYIDGSASLTDCTVSGNSSAGLGGGLANVGTATLFDTIVAGNTKPSDASDIHNSGTLTGTYNLIGTGGSGGLTNSNGNQVGIANPGLAPLGDYGGSIQSMALLPGSPAIGTGTGEIDVIQDERAAPRATSGANDIGAFQDQGYTVTVSSGSHQVTMAGHAFSAQLAARLVEDFANAALPGATIDFSAPSSGASATLGAGRAVTDTSGLASVTATANSTAGRYAVTASASGVTPPASYSLTNQVQPSFSGLSSQTVAYGGTVTFTGTIAAGGQAPTGEKVDVTLGGVTHLATIASDGSFSTQFTPADLALNASATAYNITYSYATDGVFLPATASSRLTVDPAPLVITAVSTSIIAGQAVPALSADYSGFVDGDTPASLTPPPVLASAVSQSTAPGSYPITVGGASSRDYTITYVPGTLTVIPAPATVEGVSVQKFKVSKHKTVQEIVVQFSEALDSAMAQSISSYTLATVPKSNKQKSKPVPLSSASYNSSAFTVTLLTRKALSPNSPLELTVEAASLRDALGRELDGNDSGQPGANYTADLSKAGTSVTSAKALLLIGGRWSQAVD